MATVDFDTNVNTIISYYFIDEDDEVFIRAIYNGIELFIGLEGADVYERDELADLKPLNRGVSFTVTI